MTVDKFAAAKGDTSAGFFDRLQMASYCLGTQIFAMDSLKSGTLPTVDPERLAAVEVQVVAQPNE